MRILLALLMLLAAPLQAATEEVVLGLSQSRVSITTNFDGSNILIFGAIKRETPLPENDLHVIIYLGPDYYLVYHYSGFTSGQIANSWCSGYFRQKTSITAGGELSLPVY